MNRRPAKAQTATYGQYCTILSLVSRTDQLVVFTPLGYSDANAIALLKPA